MVCDVFEVFAAVCKRVGGKGRGESVDLVVWHLRKILSQRECDRLCYMQCMECVPVFISMNTWKHCIICDWLDIDGEQNMENMPGHDP